MFVLLLTDDGNVIVSYSGATSSPWRGAVSCVWCVVCWCVWVVYPPFHVFFFLPA